MYVSSMKSNILTTHGGRAGLTLRIHQMARREELGHLTSEVPSESPLKSLLTSQPRGPLSKWTDAHWAAVQAWSEGTSCLPREEREKDRGGPDSSRLWASARGLDLGTGGETWAQINTPGKHWPQL